jgi:hypothetical protein
MGTSNTYSGRGVVHRLEWELHTGITPRPRRPASFSKAKRSGQQQSVEIPFDCENTEVRLAESGTGFAFQRPWPSDAGWSQWSGTEAHEMNEADCADYDDDSDVGIDLSRCEQLLGGKTQIYGCGLGLLWVLELSRRNPKLSISELLLELDNFIDEFGLGAVALRRADALDNSPTASWYELVNSLRWASRARRVEVGQLGIVPTTRP